MSDEAIQLIALAIAAIYQMREASGGMFQPLAYFWDFVASVAGVLANFLGRIAVVARLNYFSVVQA